MGLFTKKLDQNTLDFIDRMDRECQQVLTKEQFDHFIKVALNNKSVVVALSIYIIPTRQKVFEIVPNFKMVIDGIEGLYDVGYVSANETQCSLIISGMSYCDEEVDIQNKWMKHLSFINQRFDEMIENGWLDDQDKQTVKIFTEKMSMDYYQKFKLCELNGFPVPQENDLKLKQLFMCFSFKDDIIKRMKHF